MNKIGASLKYKKYRYRNKNENLYQPEGYKKALENNPESQQFTSLTGNVVGADGLEHNNMVPFLGQKLHKELKVEGEKVY